MQHQPLPSALARHSSTGTGTSQSSRAGVTQPPRSHGEGPSWLLLRPLSLRPPPAPSAAPSKEWGWGGSPRPPCQGWLCSWRRGHSCSQDLRDLLPASPGGSRPSPPSAPSSPSPHPPALITIGGEEAAAGAGSSRGVTPSPGEPLVGGDGGSGRRRPLPAAQHLFPEHHLTIMLFASCFFSCRFHMGNLLKVLTYNELDQGPNFFLDFESEMGFLFPFFVPYCS